MADAQTCQREIEITIPLADVEAEMDRVTLSLQQKAKLPGFRPGKAPLTIIKSRFDSDIRQQVLENLVPRAFRERADHENLKVIGTPNVTDVHFHEGAPIRFKAEFEVAPEFELGEYRGLEVEYEEPKVSDEDVEARLQVLRDQKADYVNVDPRAVVDGDHAVVGLKSLSGVEGAPVEQNEVMLHVGAEETLAPFSEALRGMTPGQECEVEVVYPEDYGAERLAGRTVKFQLTLKGLRKKELPALDDDFAQEVGDFKSVEELREEVRKTVLREREFLAQQGAKNKLIEKLVDAHDFPVPEFFVDRQIEMNLEGRLREFAAAGADLRNLKIDWNDLKKAQREPAVRDVKATLLLDRIAEREAIDAMADEVDRELQRIARQQREPVAAVRMKLEKDGTLRRIASRIRTDKTLNFLFEQSKKVAAGS